MSDPTDKDESADVEKSLQPNKELFRKDEFDSVMAALGTMVSSSNFLEQTYRHLIVQLLRCHEEESAIIVGRESRRFANTVELTEKLFAVYVPDKNAQDELDAIGKIAKGLQQKRDERVHSIWYRPSYITASPALRYKDKKNAEPVKVRVSELFTLSNNFDDCIQKLRNLMHRHGVVVPIDSVRLFH